MDNSRKINITLLIFDIIIATIAIVCFGRVYIDGFINISIGEATFQDYYPFIPLTFRGVMMSGATCLLSILFRVLSIIKPDYVQKTPIKGLRFLILTLEVFIMAVVLTCQFPYNFINEPDKKTIILKLFAGGQFEAHFIVPPLCIAYLIIGRKEFKFNWKLTFFEIVPIVAFVIEYAIGVFGTGFYDDFYHMKELANNTSYAFLAVGTVLIVILNWGLTFLIHLSINYKKNKKLS